MRSWKFYVFSLHFQKILSIEIFTFFPILINPLPVVRECLSDKYLLRKNFYEKTRYYRLLPCCSSKSDVNKWIVLRKQTYFLLTRTKVHMAAPELLGISLHVSMATAPADARTILPTTAQFRLPWFRRKRQYALLWNNLIKARSL